MTEQERKAFNAIVKAESDFYQSCFLDGVLKYNTPFTKEGNERVATRALCRLWDVRR